MSISDKAEKIQASNFFSEYCMNFTFAETVSLIGLTCRCTVVVSNGARRVGEAAFATGSALQIDLAINTKERRGHRCMHK